jgi:N-acetyl-gamma-glutamyl-phosphate reductase
MKIKTGIIGGAGYTAGELIRILLNHPQAEILFVQSASHAGELITNVHDDLLGETGIRFTGSTDLESADLVFLCQGHGKSRAWMESNLIPETLKVVDLSVDFRIKGDENPFVYGLPEINRETIRQSRFVANPGCFATGIQLALLPLAAAGLLHSEIHAHAITGSTGAGQQPTETTHFSWRESNLSAYKIFEHQHQDEIVESLCQLQPDFKWNLNFLPIRGNHTRGIFISAYTNFDGEQEEAYRLFEEYYISHPFVTISRVNPSLKQVVNTNKTLLYLEKHGNKLVVISCIDNLLKGASGQAIQNMNLMFGLTETTGLKLKAVAF